MERNVLQLFAQLDEPTTKEGTAGVERTIVYEIGQKSSGSAGNCGRLMKLPGVVVTPKDSSGATGPNDALIWPAALTPKTKAAHWPTNGVLATGVSENEIPVVASTSGAVALLVKIAKAVAKRFWIRQADSDVDVKVLVVPATSPLLDRFRVKGTFCRVSAMMAFQLTE